MSTDNIIWINGIPSAFDPAVHRATLEKQVRAKYGDDDYEFYAYEPDTHRVAFIKRSGAMLVSSIDKDTKIVHIDKSTRPSEIPRKATAFEQMYPGFYVTNVDIDAERATLVRLTGETARARDALAVALSVKPWEVGITPAPLGYNIHVPVTYVPSKHDAKLSEAVQTAIGEEGWWCHIDPKTNDGIIRPGEKPTVPISIAYPPPRPGHTWSLEEQMRIPIGVTMAYGPHPSRELSISMANNAGIMLQGVAGGGKSVLINCIIAGCLERGWNIAIGDMPIKEVDFTWCKPWVHDYWYGATSREATTAVTKMVYELAEPIRALEAEYGVVNWNSLPDEVRPAPTLLVLDELQGLFQGEEVPKGIPKDHPKYFDLVTVPTSFNVMVADFKKTVKALASQVRAHGIRLLLATQQAQGNTGFGNDLKMNLPNKILMGPRANKAARGFAFNNPETAAEVPECIQCDEAMSRGVGVVEIEGESSEVVKVYYADVADYAQRFIDLGLPQTAVPEPTHAQIAQRVILPEFPDDGPAPTRINEGGYGQTSSDTQLSGAARAAHELKLTAARARVTNTSSER